MDAVAFISDEGSTIMHSASDPSRVRFPGPLAPFAAELRAELAALGYAPTSACNQLRLASHLSRWLQAQGLGPGDLSGPVLTRFLVDRRREYTSHYSIQALGPTLRCLRRVGAAPPDDPSAPIARRRPPPGRSPSARAVGSAGTWPAAPPWRPLVRPFVDAVAATDPELTLEQSCTPKARARSIRRRPCRPSRSGGCPASRSR